ncbi:uncharacterized protein LOC115798694 [Archocentrus centrarchus]|uniref:uncharacterized protein LOC115798694 n=1 Tax=Archocentrus centrarchus TaxID=63155 RepID=UPI0011E9BFEA|nr:uncharacterized protein LOC115798694 [Archocentrus centrarchus]
MDLELACASKEKVEAELKRFPSCEEVTEWVKVVLKMTSPLADLTDMDVKSLLSMVTMKDIQDAVDKTRVELYKIERMVANKRKEEAEERGQMEKHITSEQLRIQGLMRQLSDLKAELAQREETCKSLEMQVNITEEPEIKDDLATKSRAKPQRKGRKKAVKSTEKFQDTTNKSESARSRNSNALQTLAEEEPNLSGAAAEQQKKMVKAARVKKEKAEVHDLNAQESVQPVRGRRRKPAGTAQTTVSQQKNQSKVKTGEAEAPSCGRRRAAPADAAEEAQSEGPRRSKRIASKK